MSTRQQNRHVLFMGSRERGEKKERSSVEKCPPETDQSQRKCLVVMKIHKLCFPFYVKKHFVNSLLHAGN